MTNELSQYLQEKRQLVDNQLRTVLSSQEGCPAALTEAMRYSVLAPGKRLRPLLVIMAAEACGDREGAALPAAASVELVHAYSLIHDDLPAMDDDDMRRGQPTCHKQFGEALAILAGDALLTLAFEVLGGAYPPRTAAGCCLELARGAGARGMVGGQVEDLAWEKRGGALPDLENIHSRKTGALFRACLRMGVFVAQAERPAGPDPALLESLDTFGHCFGQAFQITDDLLDVEGTAEEAGKRVHKDGARGKLTYPGFLGATESRHRAELLCRQACQELLPLGRSGDRLAALVPCILERNR
ncbi:MAG TPA: farnesyl diphosphate synthase [Gemmataceae bacterium]|nr:farnesyl diphosphate synthase [Gemmataceae bacterium]